MTFYAGRILPCAEGHFCILGGNVRLYKIRPDPKPRENYKEGIS